VRRAILIVVVIDEVSQMAVVQQVFGVLEQLAPAWQ